MSIAVDSLPSGQFIADPSLLFAGDGLEWLEDDATRAALVVPQTLVDWLEGAVELDPYALLAAEDAELFTDRRERVSALLREVRSFSHREVRLAPRSLEEVRVALLTEREPLAQLRADEWAFLQSQSAMISKLRRPLEAFRDAGAVIVELGRKAGVHLVERVIPKKNLPETLTRKVLATAAVKWLVLGGATVGGGTLGGVAGSALAGPAGAFIGSKAGGFGAGAATNAALLAIDP